MNNTFRKPLTLIAVAGCLLALTVSVQAQTQTVQIVRVVPVGSVLDSSKQVPDFTVIVLTAKGETQDIAPGCGTVSGASLPVYNAVALYPGRQDAAPAVPFEIGLVTPLPPGTRLANVTSDARQCCLNDNRDITVPCAAFDARFAVWVSTMEVVKPNNSSPLLFTSTADITGDSMGVITGQQDENGFANLLLTSKGTKPTFATLLTDEQLEPADRLVDIIQLDYDPETGIALYGAFLEY